MSASILSRALEHASPTDDALTSPEEGQAPTQDTSKPVFGLLIKGKEQSYSCNRPWRPIDDSCEVRTSPN
jgi:hypothetical protein